MERRNFLKKVGSGLGLTTFGALVYPSLRYMFPSREASSAGKVVISKNEIKDRKFMEIMVNKTPAMLLRKAGGGYVALSRVCTHLGCLVGFDEVRVKLVCPCHAASFTMDGRVMDGPAPRALDSYTVSIDGDKIIIG